jgi:hypothetical protein
MELRINRLPTFTAPDIKPLARANLGDISSGVDAYESGVGLGKSLAAPLVGAAETISYESSPRGQAEKEFLEKKNKLAGLQIDEAIANQGKRKPQLQEVGGGLFAVDISPEGTVTSKEVIPRTAAKAERAETVTGKDGTIYERIGGQWKPVVKGKEEAQIPEGFVPKRVTKDGVTFEDPTAPSSGAANRQSTEETSEGKFRITYDAKGNIINRVKIGESTKGAAGKALTASSLQKLGDQVELARLAGEASQKIASLEDSDIGPIDATVNKFVGGNPKFNDAIQSYSAVRNQILKLRSGGAVTPSEAERLLEELGSPTQFSEQRFRSNMESFAARMAQDAENRLIDSEESGYKVPENLYQTLGVKKPAKSKPTAGTAPQSEEIIEVATKEEAAALPSGTRFTFQGKPYTKD